MNTKLRLAVVGSRSFEDVELMRTWIDFACHGVMPADIEIVSGGARGADGLAAKYAFDTGLAYKEFPAEWDFYDPQCWKEAKHADRPARRRRVGLLGW